MSPEEFSSRIKTKYPQYKDIPDNELAQKIIAKHPEYQSQVDFSEQKAQGLTETLITNKPTEGITQELARSSPAIGGALAGAYSGASLGAPLGPAGAAAGAIGGAVIGGGAGEALRQGASNIYAALRPEKQYPIANVQKVLGSVGQASKEQGLAQAGGELAGPLAKAAQPYATKAISGLATRLGGLSEYAANIFEKNAPTVMKYVRMGTEEAGQVAERAATKVQEMIDPIVRDAGVKYRKILDDMFSKGRLYNIKFEEEMSPTIASIRENFGFGAGKTNKEFLNYDKQLQNMVLERTLTEDEASQLMQEYNKKTGGYVVRTAGKETEGQFNDLVKEIQRLKNATPTQVFQFHQKLSNIVRENLGKPVSALAMQMKRQVEGLLPDVGNAVSTYREANELATALKRVSKADDAVRVINSAFRRGTKTSKALMKAVESNPAINDPLQELFNASAGKEGSRLIRQFPHTSLLGSLVAAPLGVGFYSHSIPAAAATAIAEAGITSPYLYSNLYNLAAQAPQIVSSIPAQTAYRMVPASIRALQTQRSQ